MYSRLKYYTQIPKIANIDENPSDQSYDYDDNLGPFYDYAEDEEYADVY